MSSRGRTHNKSTAMEKTTCQKDLFGLSCYITVSTTHPINSSSDNEDYDERREVELPQQDRMHNSASFHAEMMGDFMSFHQVLKQLNFSCQQVCANQREIIVNMDNKHWELINKFDPPENMEASPSV